MNKLNYKYETLTPFKICVLENFPFLEADFDALTNYQIMCKLAEYINKVAKSQNILQKNIIELNNWFNNLDVQEEINNKLDKMAQSGELQNIISAYLNLNGVLSFNTVADMIASENIVSGSTCRTLGKLSYNDGYGRLYKIEHIISADENEVDGINLINLNRDDLYARLIKEEYNIEFSRIEKNIKYISVENYGLVGDGLTDDTQAIQNAFNSGNENILFPNKTILVKSPITIPNTVKNIDFQNSHIKYDYEQVENVVNDLFSIENNEHLNIYNGKLEYLGTYDFNNQSYAGLVSGIKITNSNFILIKGTEITKFNRDGIKIANTDPSENYCNDITIDSCYLHHNRVGGVIFGNTKNLRIINCTLTYNGIATDSHTGYGLAGASDYKPIDSYILNNTASFNYRKGIDFHSGINGIIDNNICEGNILYGIYYTSNFEIGTWHITNNIIKNMKIAPTDSNNAKYGILLGADSNNTFDKQANFIVQGNSIFDCISNENNDFYSIYLNMFNLYEGIFNINNNYINCENVGAILFSNGTSRKSIVILNNNYFKSNRCKTIPVFLNDPNFDTYKVVNNYIEVTNNPQANTIGTVTPNNINTCKIIYINNIAISPNNVEESVFLSRAVTNMLKRLNIINNKVFE